MEVNVVHVCAAQQEAQRAQFYVEKAKQDQKQKIIQAEGEAQAAKMVNKCLDICHTASFCLCGCFVAFRSSLFLSFCLFLSGQLSCSPSHLYAFFHRNDTFAELCP